MKVSLIITTYNRPSALKLVLESVLKQTLLPNEIIIADDGSNKNTKKQIDMLSYNSKIPIIHIWQEDLGFRAAMIRNKAIAYSSGEYIIMIDGDILLEKNFIFDHINASARGIFIQGKRVLLGKEITNGIIANKYKNINIFSRNISNRKNCIRSKILSLLTSKLSYSTIGIKTCNFSLYRDDILSVNGFDNSFVGWGREDSEFAIRLVNKGIKRKDLKFRAIAYHLYHPENTRACLPANNLKLQKTIKEKLTVCQNGIDIFLNQSLIK